MIQQRFTRIFLLILITIAGPSVSRGQWRNIGPGGGSDLQSIAIHPTNPNIVYLGGDIEGLFKTTDGGATWRSVNANLAAESWTPDVYWTNQVLFDRSDAGGQTLFLCTAVALFKSTNGGDSWELLLPEQVFSADDFLNVTSIAQDPQNPQILYAGTAEKGVYRSTNGGQSWTKLAVPLASGTTVYGIVIAPGAVVILGTTDGIWVSTDGGASWQERNNGLPHRKVWNLQGIETNGKFRLYCTLVTHGVPGNAASFQGGLYASTDLGQSWQERNGDLPRMQSDGLFYFYWRFAVNPLNPQTLYIGTGLGYPDEGLAAYEDWGIYRSHDGGQHWVKIDTSVVEGWMDQTFFDERHALVLAMAPSDTSVLYWGRDWIYRTDDAGATWRQVYTRNTPTGWQGNGFELMMAEALAFSPSRPGTLFVGYDDMGPFRSTDGGETFTPLDPQMDPYDGYDAVKDILIDPDNGDIYISRYDGFGSAFNSNYGLGRIYVSHDNGDSWTDLSAGFPDGRPDLAVDFASGSGGQRTLYAASYGHGLYRRSGNSWTAVNNGLGAEAAKVWEILIHPNNPNELYLGLNGFGNGGGLYKSTDGGASWSRLSAFPDLDVLCIAFDAATGALYAAGTENYDWSAAGGLYRSRDGGATWKMLTDLPRVVDVAIDPTNSEVLYIAQQSWYDLWQPEFAPGIYRSTDGGATWKNISGDLGHTFVLFVEIEPRAPYSLFVGTGGGGLWRLSGTTAVESEPGAVPQSFELRQNYPNPFNPATTIELWLPRKADVNLRLYDRRGRLVRTLLQAPLAAGLHRVKLEAADLPAGLYFVQMKAGGFSAARKILLVK